MRMLWVGLFSGIACAALGCSTLPPRDTDSTGTGGSSSVTSSSSTGKNAATTSASGTSESGSSTSTGSVDPSGDKEPYCGGTEQCMGNHACTTEAVAACQGAAFDPTSPIPCQADADCDSSPGAYCHTCEGGARNCSSACQSDANCAPSEACVANHCTLRSCSQDSDCPANFACADSEAGKKECKRKSCQVDSDCAGNCVLHECQTALGSCVCEGC
jgi:hypothetical protein